MNISLNNLWPVGWLLFTCFWLCHSMLKEEPFGYSCNPSLTSMGKVNRTIENIYHEVTDPFRVTCHFDSSFQNISVRDVILTRDISDTSNSFGSKILDHRTIGLDVMENKSCVYNLYCKDATNVFCLLTVIIGYSPLSVKNFRCISINWSVLECSYDLEHNPAQGTQDEYRLSYESAFGSVRGHKCKSGSSRRCACHLRGSECWRWDNTRASKFQYNKDSQFLVFNLRSKNPLGSYNSRHVVDQYERMLPTFKLSLEVIPEGPRHLRVSLTMPRVFRTFPPGFIYEIKWEVCGHEHLIIDNMTGIHVSRVVRVNWPGQEYRVSARVRSGANPAKDDHDDEWWSPEVSKGSRTPPLPPWKAPNVDVGSFQVVPDLGSNVSRSVALMWHQLECHLEGGTGFEYEVQVWAEGTKIEYAPTLVTKTYAKIRNLSNNIHYTFHVRPRNEAGAGNGTSVFEVGQTPRLPRHIFFPQLIYDHERQVIHLKWFSSEEHIDHFTIFWCQHEPGEQMILNGPCEGDLTWKHLLTNETEAILTQDDFGGSAVTSSSRIRFGVSAQRISGSRIISGGLVWAECPLLEGTSYGGKANRDPYLKGKHITFSSAILEWRLNCSQWRGNPVSTQVMWCQRDYNQSTQCSANTAPRPLSSTFFQITDLEPNQNYTAWLIINYKNWTSQIINPIHFTTDIYPIELKSMILITTGIIIIVLPLLYIFFRCLNQLLIIYRKAKDSITIPTCIKYPEIYPSNRNESKNQHEKGPASNDVLKLEITSKSPLLSFSKYNEVESETCNKLDVIKNSNKKENISKLTSKNKNDDTINKLNVQLSEDGNDVNEMSRDDDLKGNEEIEMSLINDKTLIIENQSHYVPIPHSLIVKPSEDGYVEAIDFNDNSNSLIFSQHLNDYLPGNGYVQAIPIGNMPSSTISTVSPLPSVIEDEVINKMNITKDKTTTNNYHSLFSPRPRGSKCLNEHAAALDINERMCSSIFSTNYNPFPKVEGKGIIDIKLLNDKPSISHSIPKLNNKLPTEGYGQVIDCNAMPNSIVPAIYPPLHLIQKDEIREIQKIKHKTATNKYNQYLENTFSEVNISEINAGLVNHFKILSSPSYKLKKKEGNMKKDRTSNISPYFEMPPILEYQLSEVQQEEIRKQSSEDKASPYFTIPFIQDYQLPEVKEEKNN